MHTHTRAHITHTRTLIITTRVRVYVHIRTPDPHCIYMLIAERFQYCIIALSSLLSAFSQCFVVCLFCSITFFKKI